MWLLQLLESSRTDDGYVVALIYTKSKIPSVSFLPSEYTYTVLTLTRHFGRLLHGRLIHLHIQDRSIVYIIYCKFLDLGQRTKANLNRNPY